jgi:hypothetical protein
MFSKGNSTVTTIKNAILKVCCFCCVREDVDNSDNMIDESRIDARGSYHHSSMHTRNMGFRTVEGDAIISTQQADLRTSKYGIDDVVQTTYRDDLEGMYL